MAFTIKVNGSTHSVDVDGDTPLLWVLRDVLGMNGTKFGCGMALCGACTVHRDGAPIRSCITPVDSIGASEITTIEAIGATAAGAEPIRPSWAAAMVMAAVPKKRRRCWLISSNILSLSIWGPPWLFVAQRISQT
jgi:aerobic-type carbon monoxide dehydrogenase small subunit (CoxS/CutS family)